MSLQETSLTRIFPDSLQDRIQITRLDWEIAIGSDALEKMLEWEVKTFGSSENRPLLILGSDIVSMLRSCCSSYALTNFYLTSNIDLRSRFSGTIGSNFAFSLETTH